MLTTIDQENLKKSIPDHSRIDAKPRTIDRFR